MHLIAGHELVDDVSFGAGRMPDCSFLSWVSHVTVVLPVLQHAEQVMMSGTDNWKSVMLAVPLHLCSLDV